MVFKLPNKESKMPPVKRKDDLKIFDDLAEIASGIWVDFFRGLAIGKFPNKVKVITQNTGRVIAFKRNSKQILCQVPTHADRQQLERVMKFFTDEVGVGVVGTTPNEPIEIKQKPLLDRLQSLRSSRNVHLCNFVTRIAKRDGLKKNEQDQLFALIAIHWLAGLINKEFVIVEPAGEGTGECIADINGLRRGEDGVYYFELPAVPRPTRRAPAKKKSLTLQEQYDIFTDSRSSAMSVLSTEDSFDSDLEDFE